MTTVGLIIALFFVMGATALAYWHREQGGYYIAGFAQFLYGLLAIPTISWLSVLFMLFGGWLFYKGVHSP